MSEQQQVDLGQLFFRTVSGIRDFLERPVDANSDPQTGGQSPLSDSPMSSSSARAPFASGSPLAGIFGGGNTCFKACGMDDIQMAAQRAGELFITLRTCAVVFTVIAAIFVLLLTVVVVYLAYKHSKQQFDVNSDTSDGPRGSRRPFIPTALSLFQRRGDRVDDHKPNVQVQS